MPRYSSHTIIIPVYNALEDVIRCLKSIEHSLDLDTVELIIIDDCSMHTTHEFLMNFSNKYPHVRFYHHEKNKGYLLSVNEGISYAKNDIITLLNSDTTIPKDFTQRILDCFNHRSKIGIASPILASGNPFSIPLHKRLSPLEVDKMDALVKGNVPTYPTIVFPDGACFSISRDCLNTVGLFNEEYAMGYFEELDYCMRAYEAGFDTVYIDNMYVYHRSHASFGKEETRKHMARNRKLFHDMWDTKYAILHKKFPKTEHKKRIYLNFYSCIKYLYTKYIVILSKFIPISSIRRNIRSKYQ